MSKLRANSIQHNDSAVENIVLGDDGSVILPVPYFHASGNNFSMPDSTVAWVTLDGIHTNIGGFTVDTSGDGYVIGVPFDGIYSVSLSVRYSRSGATRFQLLADISNNTLAPGSGRAIITEGVNQVGGTVWASASGVVPMSASATIRPQVYFQGTSTSNGSCDSMTIACLSRL
jgi:hypothetical protein